MGTEPRLRTPAPEAGQAVGPPFGDLLRRLRLAAGLTQEELAERSGVSGRSISDFERGLPHRPRPDTLALLAEALGLTPAQRAAFVAAGRRRPSAASAPAAPTRLRPLDGGHDLTLPPLPAPPTPLVGRERELAEVAALLEEPGVRLVTLIGPGGVGKTRLALAIAAQRAAAGAGGVSFVALAALRDPRLVLPTIARVLGLREAAERPPLQIVAAALRERDLLLVLDNCEHLPDAAPELAALLAACPRLTLLATSRAPLRLRGEREWPLPPLAPPAPGQAPEPEAVRRSPAAQLFLARAREVRPQFALDAANAGPIAALVARLDGLPLAIELAAPLLRVLSPAALLAQLGEPRSPVGASPSSADSRASPPGTEPAELGAPLQVLVGGARDLPERQQSLRAAIAWSYDLLSPDQQALFRRLAVFVGGCSLEAAEAVASRGDEGMRGRGDEETVGAAAALLDPALPSSPHPLITPSAASRPGSASAAGLAALAEQSLLQAEEGSGGEPRCCMLETIREYAAERLAEQGEWEGASRRHAAYFLALAEAATPELRGPRQREWLDRLEREHDNLRAVLDRCGESHAPADRAVALRLAAALGPFWRTRGYLTEGGRRLEEALARSPGPEDSARATALVAAGQLAIERRELERASAHFAQALALPARADEGRQAAMAQLGLADLALLRGEHAAAEARYRQVANAARAAGQRWVLAAALTNLALALRRRGEPAQATACGEEALALLRELGDRQGEARVLLALADLAYDREELAAAGALSDEALAVLRALGDRLRVPNVLARLAAIAARRGDDAAAAARCREGLALADALGQPPIVAGCMEVLAGIARRAGQPARAARLLGAAAAGRERHGLPRHWDAAGYEREAAALRLALGEEAFAAEWSAGRALTRRQLLAGCAADPDDPFAG